MIEDELLDTSNYTRTHHLYSNKLNARLSCIKDEFKGETCEEVVLLAPKCYSFKFAGDKNKATAKGVGRAVKNRLTHNDYKDRFLHQTRMQSYKHHIHNISQSKIALSFFENKRAWVGVNESLPYGH